MSTPGDPEKTASLRKPDPDRLRTDMQEITRKLRKLGRCRRKEEPVSGEQGATAGGRRPDRALELARRLLGVSHGPPQPEPPAFHAPDLRRRAKGRGVEAMKHDAPLSLERAAPGVEHSVEEGLTAWVIHARLAERTTTGKALDQALVQLWLEADGDSRAWLTPRQVVSGLEDLLFMDLETTGLDATPLFLIGTMEWEQGLVLNQYLARHYAEERAVLSLFLQAAAQKRVLITFNGRTYDIPYMRARAAALGLPFGLELAHLDLLPTCRRVWRRQLPDCKLRTLEQHILGRPPRRDDLPSSEIPRVYHEFVRTGDAGLILPVLEHNVRDLVTMGELMARLLEAGVAP